MSLKRKALLGVFWTFSDFFFVKGLSFVAMLFLARWLGPSEFGLIGMIAVFIAIGTSLVDSGLSSSIIRTKDANNSDFTTVFYMNVSMSILVYGVLFFSAPYIAIFYNQEILTEVVRVYCLSFVVSALSAVQLAILNKKMQFKRLTMLNVPSTIIGVCTGLYLGYHNYGVWSIVAMYLTTQVLFSILLWLNSSWKPTFHFSKEKFLFHYGFGYKLMLSGLLDKVFKNSYNILIGKFFPVQMLGYFERAKRFNDYPSKTITGIIGKVTYPIMASLQDNPEKLSVIYKKMLRVAFFITAPLMLGAAAVAYPLFDLVLGDEWIEAVPFFQIVSISSMLYPIHAFNINVLKVYGRSDLFLKLEIIKKVITVVAICIGFRFGIMGLVWSSVITSFIALLINTHFSSQLINYKTGRQLLDMLPIVLVAGAMFCAIYFSAPFFTQYSSIIQLLLLVSIGTVFYVSINLLSSKSPLYDLMQIIKKKKI